MEHISLQIQSVPSAMLGFEPSFRLPLAAPNAGDAVSHFIINPWLGLIGLGVLLVTGAIAVIREIQIEEEDGRK